MIYVKSKSMMKEALQKRFPNARVIDITSGAEEPFVQLSPFYPVGDIPIPLSDGHFSKSVEGLWQGLKVFETHDIDPGKFENDQMKGLKRTVRKFGKVSGHRAGVEGKELLDYITARKKIYLPAYRWVLENKVSEVVEKIRRESEKQDIVLLDYETNGDVNEPKKPLSHAYLVKYYVEGKYPK